MKKPSRNNRFKILALAWNEEFELPDGSYSVSYFHYYFENISRKHGEKTDNPSIRIHINRIEHRITSRINTGNYLEILTPETMKLFGSAKSNITKNKNGEKVPFSEVVLLHYDNGNKIYQ